MKLFGFLRKKRMEQTAPRPPTVVVREIDHDGANVRDAILTSNACGGTNPDLPPQAAFRVAPETPVPAENEPVRDNRDQRLRIRLTQKEMDHVKRCAKEAGIDCSKYVRSILNSAELIPTPQPDCEALRTMLNRPGRRLDDILARANTTGFIDIPELERTLPDLWACYREIAIHYGGEDDNEKTAM